MLESMLRGGGSVRRIGWLDAAYTMLRASHFTSHAHDDFVSSIVAPPEFGFSIERLRGEKRNREFLPLVKHRLVMNWTLMHGLARPFGVRTLFGLQPTVFGKEVLAAEEREHLESEIADLLKESWLELERFAHEEALRLELPLFDAGLHVRSHPGRMFIDYCHMLAEGNRLWAESMAVRIDEEIRDGSGFAEWDGVRFPFAEGDPLWRPSVFRTQNPAADRAGGHGEVVAEPVIAAGIVDDGPQAPDDAVVQQPADGVVHVEIQFDELAVHGPLSPVRPRSPYTGCPPSLPQDLNL